MKKLYLLFLFILLLPQVMAIPIDSNVITYNIQNNIVNVKNEISFDLDYNIQIQTELPIKHTDLRVTLDDYVANYKIEDNKLKLDVKKEDKILIIQYKTKDFIERARKRFFIAEFENPFHSDFLLLEVKLPEGYILDKSIDEGKSVYPEPTEVTSDGQRIIIRWQKNNVEGEEKIPIFITYKKKTDLSYYLIPFIIIILILLFLIIKILKTKKKEIKRQIKIKEKIIKKPELHLKEDEKQIIRIIKQKGGRVEQTTIVTISDFSKAKVSQLIKELEERGIIKKLEKGKKNIIILKSQHVDTE